MGDRSEKSGHKAVYCNLAWLRQTWHLPMLNTVKTALTGMQLSQVRRQRAS